MSSEDAASVLDHFINDVANLPAELAHLLEEIQAKDQIMQECLKDVNKKNTAIENFIKANTSAVVNPQEEKLTKIIREKYERADHLQKEKDKLARKAEDLMDRHVRRLDVKIQALITEGTLPPDPTLPSIVNKKSSSSSTPITGSSTPLNPVTQSSINTSAAITNSSIARLAQLPMVARTQSPLISHTAQNSLLQSSHLSNTTPSSPANNSPQPKRESSVGAIEANKRRRLNNVHLGSLPPTPSNLARSSSLGPGTPKPGTPNTTTAPASVRASSAAPKPNIVHNLKKKKVAPHQQMRKKALLKKQSLKKTSKKPSSSNGIKNSPSTSDDEASEASGSGTAGVGSDDEMLSPPSGSGGEEEVDEEGDSGDTNVYCFCRTVSHGNMVACDNPNCPNEWFHWPCVGLTKEPPQGGTWYCPECRPKMAGSVPVKVS